MNRLWKYAPLVAVIMGAITFRVWADYALTQGSGTNFASKVISTVHYPATLTCDATAGETQCAAVSAAGAVKVDGSAATQPVSGTVTSNQGTGGATAWLVTGTGGTFPVSQPTAANLNATVVQPTAANLNATVTGTVAVSSISGAVTLPTGAATAANQTSEITQLTTIANNTGAAVPACSGTPCTTIIGTTSNDPCSTQAKTTVPVSQASAAATVITGVASKKTYICGGVLIANPAETISIIEGTTATCGTGTTLLAGSTTAANGIPLSANGGFQVGGGSGTAIAATAAAADNVCITQSVGTSRVSGWLTIVQQ